MNVECKDSPSGRHEWRAGYDMRSGLIFVKCLHNPLHVLYRDEMERLLNAAMLLSDDEAEHLYNMGLDDVLDGLLLDYARTWRGDDT